LTGNEADAADLTQETFYLWANRGHQLQKAASVKGWLFATLHREFLKICRRRNRFSNESIAEATEDLPNVPPDCAERADS
jgi:RNA polymerase sigma-70 factor (ECF subfamily)